MHKMQKNKGYSLIELVITMAIFSIIMVAIIMMMRTSLASYKEGLFETTKQEEAQLVANQITDLLVDATQVTDTTDGGDGYAFVGPHGAFRIYQTGTKLILNQGGADHVLSDSMASGGFSISGLSVRADKVSTPDNEAVVTVGIEYEGKTYSSSKVAFFRNEIEDYGVDGEGNPLFSPFDVTGGPTSSSGGTNPGDEKAKVLRYHPLNVSQEYDIVYDATLSAAAQPYFVDLSTTTSNNTMITNPISGKTAKQYVLKLAPTYETETGYTSSFSGDNIYIEGLNSKGENVKVFLELDAVSFDVGGGVFAIYQGSDQNDKNGYPTYITAKGIHINDAIKSGVAVSYTAEVKSNSSKVFGLSNSLKSISNGIPNVFDYNNGVDPTTSNLTDPDTTGYEFRLGVCPNPIDGGIAISLPKNFDYGNIGNRHLDFMKTDSGNKNEIIFNFKIGTKEYPNVKLNLMYNGTPLDEYN